MVKIKQASLNNSLVNLNYCKIVSPVDGVVILRAVELGQTVASSFSTPTIFVAIANDLTKMQIDSSVAEADVGGVIEGQQVDFTVDAYPDRTFYGTVTQVRNSPTTVNNVVTYDCVIGVTNADYKLKPGMTANVSITVAQRDSALLHPQRRAALPGAGQRRGADQYGRIAGGARDQRSGRRQCPAISPGGSRRTSRRRAWARRTSGFSYRLCADRRGQGRKIAGHADQDRHH